MNNALPVILQYISNNSKEPLLIAIDGRCTAGKTTLASIVKEKINCNVIHMDHFFPPAVTAYRREAARARRQCGL